MTPTETDQTRRVAEAERRVAEANRRVANCHAAERRAEQVDKAEGYAVAAEQRAAEAERRANASVATRPIAGQSHPRPITAPAPTPAQRHPSKAVPAMSTRKQALLREVESASFRLATARQGLEDAKHLARAGTASDPVFAAHVLAGAVNNRNRACAAYLSFKG